MILYGMCEIIAHYVMGVEEGRAAMAGTRNSTTQAVSKAVRVLACFGAAGATSLGVADLSAMTGWTPSTVGRLLSALEDGGLVQRDEASGRYLLGLQLVALAGTALATNALYAVCHPHLIRLAMTSGETANLCVPEGATGDTGGTVLVIDEVLGTHPIKLSGWLGTRHPLHAGSAGKVLLAALPPEQRDLFLATADLSIPTAPAPIDPARLRDELERVTTLGYALSVKELAADLTSAGAPVRDHGGVVVGALTAAGPSYRLAGRRLERCAALVKEEAAAASRALGYHPAAA